MDSPRKQGTAYLALRTAASIAGVMLTTEALMAYKEEDGKKSAAAETRQS